MIKHKTSTTTTQSIPIFGSVPQITALRCIAQIPLELTQGQFLDVRARCTATSNYTGDNNVNFVRRIRIEPTPDNNWGLNLDPIKGNDDYCVIGQVGFRFNGNITPNIHHYSPELTDTWEVTETGLWYIKLCARSHSSGALSTDRLDIDRLELEVLVN